MRTINYILKHYAENYVNNPVNSNKLKVARRCLSRLHGTDEKAAAEIWSMSTITHMAIQERKKPFDLVQRFATKEANHVALNQLVNEVRRYGLEVAKAKAKDKNLKELNNVEGTNVYVCRVTFSDYICLK